MRHDGSVHRHGLRGIFDAAGGAEPAMGTQRVVRESMARRAAPDADRIPNQHLVEEAHAPVMRDVPLDPGAIQVCEAG
jgi:hypothetical protein